MTARAVSTPHRPFVDTKQSSINQLDALRQLTTVVADTGELDLLQRYTPQDCTTNPTLVLRALSQPSMQHLLVAQGHADAADRLVVALGAEIVKHIRVACPPRWTRTCHTTRPPPWTRHVHHSSATFAYSSAQALHLLDLYSLHGVDPSRVYIKIASTWEGIQACAILQKQGIACNMTLLFNLAQAVAAADAGAALISPFVGRIRDWHMKKEGREFAAHEVET